MTEQGKANYEGYYAAMPGSSPVPFGELPHAERLRWDAGACSVELRLAEAPAGEDMPGNEPQPAKVIIVTAPANGSERRYDADGYTITGGTLFVNRHGTTAACHPAGTWTSFRFGDAIADDSQRKALGIAMRALSGIVRRADDGGAAPFGRPEIGGIASTALNDIWTETEG